MVGRALKGTMMPGEQRSELCAPGITGLSHVQPSHGAHGITFLVRRSDPCDPEAADDPAKE
jgi:hypothetical protein